MKTCGNCAYKALQDGKCPVFGREMSPEQVGCPIFSTTIKKCALCGNVIFYQSVIDYDEDQKPHIICRNCVNATACETCKNSNVCSFQTDHNCQEPPYIMHEVRQGNMVMQTQIPNPKRVMATCAHCDCFNEEGLDNSTHCRKQAQCGCKNQKMNWRD